MDKTMLESIRSNNHRDLSKAISRIINDEDLPKEYFVKIHPHTHKSLRIGVTGPPGVGKSSLVDKLIIHFLSPVNLHLVYFQAKQRQIQQYRLC